MIVHFGLLTVDRSVAYSRQLTRTHFASCQRPRYDAPRELMPGLRATYEWPQLGSEHPVGTPALVPICLAGSAAPAGGTSVLS